MHRENARGHGLPPMYEILVRYKRTADAVKSIVNERDAVAIMLKNGLRYNKVRIVGFEADGQVVKLDSVLSVDKGVRFVLISQIAALEELK